MISNDTLLSSLALEASLKPNARQMPLGKMAAVAGGPKSAFLIKRSKTPEQRVLEKIEKHESGCWIWVGAKDRDGYGQISMRYRHFKAHRFVFTLFGGTIPAGMVLDHQCNNPSCVNPEHMRPMTVRENNLRGFTATAKNIAKTACPLGHEYAGVNLYMDRNGHRHCRACRTEARRRFKARTKKP